VLAYMMLNVAMVVVLTWLWLVLSLSLITVSNVIVFGPVAYSLP